MKHNFLSMLKVWESNGGYEGMFVLMEIDDCFAAMLIHYFQHNDWNLRAKNAHGVSQRLFPQKPFLYIAFLIYNGLRLWKRTEYDEL